MAQITSPQIFAIIFFALLTAASQGIGQQVADVTTSPQEIAQYIDTLPTDIKGFFGEDVVRDLYSHTQREDILGKWRPNQDGPDLFYRLSNGRFEVHEVKAYKGWPGHQSLKTKVNEQIMEQLSDIWLQKWINRTVTGGPYISNREKEAARLLKDALENKNLDRVFDELNLATGEIRSSVALPDSTSTVKLESKMGPFKIERYKERLIESRAKMAALKSDAKNGRAILFKKPVLSEFREAPKVFSDYEPSLQKLGHRNLVVGPGLLFPDGRLITVIKFGVSEGTIVFAIDGGVASYQYMNGNILLPEFKRKVADAAVNGICVGGATAVAVVVAGGPGGWVLLGVGIGTYFVSDTVMQTWHARNDRRYVSMEDLRNLGLQVESVLEPKWHSLLRTDGGDGFFGIKQSLDSPLGIGRSPPNGPARK